MKIEPPRCVIAEIRIVPVTLFIGAETDLTVIKRSSVDPRRKSHYSAISAMPLDTLGHMFSRVKIAVETI